ncbi:MAG: hypothetical protein AAGG48_23700 [Planctomycetota bacterium]
MSLRLQKLVLRLSTATLFGVAIWQIVSGVNTVDESAGKQPTRPRSELVGTQQATDETPERVLQFNHVASVSLQQQLFDPPPPPPPEVKAEPPPPPVRDQLIGTVIDPDRPQAIIRNMKGSVTFRAIGQAVSDAYPNAIIEEIKESSIVLRRGEFTETLEIQ